VDEFFGMDIIMDNAWTRFDIMNGRNYFVNVGFQV